TRRRHLQLIAAAAPPSSVIKSRRLMCSPQAEDHTLPYPWKRRVVHHSILAHATSATGHEQPKEVPPQRVRCSFDSSRKDAEAALTLSATSRHMQCSKNRLLDHLVGAQ